MIARYATAVSTGTFVTFALIFVMQALIGLQPIAMSDPRVPRVLGWHKIKPPEPPPPIPEPIKVEDLTTVPTAPRPNFSAGSGPAIGVRYQGPAGPKAKYEMPQQQYIDGPLVAMIRVAPIYPAVMTAKGIEGHVLVQFDVMADGHVANIIVIESSHRGFDKAAIKAAARFKFKPRVIDGVPLSSTGIQNLFRFRMEED